MVKAVRCFETTENGQQLTNIIYSKDGQLINRVVTSSPITHEINQIIKEGYLHPQTGKDISPQNHEEFLNGLKYRFTGAYYRCSDVEEIDESEVE